MLKRTTLSLFGSLFLVTLLSCAAPSPDPTGTAAALNDLVRAVSEAVTRQQASEEQTAAAVASLAQSICDELPEQRASVETASSAIAELSDTLSERHASESETAEALRILMESAASALPKILASEEKLSTSLGSLARSTSAALDRQRESHAKVATALDELATAAMRAFPKPEEKSFLHWVLPLASACLKFLTGVVGLLAAGLAAFVAYKKVRSVSQEHKYTVLIGAVLCFLLITTVLVSSLLQTTVIAILGLLAILAFLPLSVALFAKIATDLVPELRAPVRNWLLPPHHLKDSGSSNKLTDYLSLLEDITAYQAEKCRFDLPLDQAFVAGYKTTRFELKPEIESRPSWRLSGQSLVPRNVEIHLEGAKGQTVLRELRPTYAVVENEDFESGKGLQLVALEEDGFAKLKSAFEEFKKRRTK